MPRGKAIALPESFIVQIKVRWGKDGGPKEGNTLARQPRGVPSPEERASKDYAAVVVIDIEAGGADVAQQGKPCGAGEIYGGGHGAGQGG